MPLRQKVLAISLSVGLLIVIFELVRRRKLREEYSWLWILTGAVIFILAMWYDLLLFMTHLVGAVLPASTLFFFGIFFLVLINLYFSVKVSALTSQIKKLTQELAILNSKVESYSSKKRKLKEID